jgi:hypothetical protein
MDNMAITHVAPCCQHTYKKYMNADYKVDMDRYNKIENERKIGLLEEKLLNNPDTGIQWGNLKRNNRKEYDSLVSILIEVFNFGIDRANLAASIIDDPNDYCGNTGSEWPATQIIDREEIFKQKISI